MRVPSPYTLYYWSRGSAGSSRRALPFPPAPASWATSGTAEGRRGAPATQPAQCPLPAALALTTRWGCSVSSTPTPWVLNLLSFS